MIMLAPIMKILRSITKIY